MEEATEKKSRQQTGFRDIIKNYKEMLIASNVPVEAELWDAGGIEEDIEQQKGLGLSGVSDEEKREVLEHNDDIVRQMKLEKKPTLEELKTLNRYNRLNATRELLSRESARAAFQQTDIPLTATISAKAMQVIVMHRSRLYLKRAMNAYKEARNRISSAFLKNLPYQERVRLMHGEMERSIPAPGFVYTTKNPDEKTGEQHSVWMKPLSIYLCEQGKELDFLHSQPYQEHIEKADKWVHAYFAQLKRAHDIQVRTAGILIGRDIRTYFQLLKYNPVWFAGIYEQTTKKRLVDAEKISDIYREWGFYGFDKIES